MTTNETPAPATIQPRAAAHTPTPWAIGSDPTVIYDPGDDEDEPAIAVTWDEDRGVFAWLDDRETAEANARFIARACNAHDALVAALELLLSPFDHLPGCLWLTDKRMPCQCDPRGRASRAKDQALAALALAKETA